MMNDIDRLSKGGLPSMSHAAAVKRTAEEVLGKDKIVSSDSHIMEPPDLWEANLTPSLKAKFPQFPPRSTAGEKPGGHDPRARLDEMAVDGVSAEVLYATHGAHAVHRHLVKARSGVVAAGL